MTKEQLSKLWAVQKALAIAQENLHAVAFKSAGMLHEQFTNHALEGNIAIHWSEAGEYNRAAHHLADHKIGSEEHVEHDMYCKRAEDAAMRANAVKVVLIELKRQRQGKR